MANPLVSTNLAARDRHNPAMADIHTDVDKPIQLDELIITVKGEAPTFKMLEKTLLTLGRETTNDVPLVNTAVSRHHARLQKREEAWFVTDLGSTNGTFLAKERLDANVEYAWQSGHPLQVGPFTLQWQSPRDLTSGQTLMLMPEAMKQLDLVDAKEIEQEVALDELVNVMLDQPELELGLGDSAEIKLGILSQAKLEKVLEIIVAGIPEHWIDLSSEKVTVEPKKHRSASLKINVPQSMMVEAGEYDFEVIVQDIYNKAQVSRLPGKIVIKPVRDFSVRMVQGGGNDFAPVKLTIRNLGNTKGIYNIAAESERLKVTGEKWTATLLPGQSVDMQYDVSAESRALFGKLTKQPYTLTVKAEDGETKDVPGALQLTPSISTPMLVAGLIAFTLLLIVLTLILR